MPTKKRTNKIKRTNYKGRISENNTTREQFRILSSNPGRLKVSENIKSHKGESLKNKAVPNSKTKL